MRKLIIASLLLLTPLLAVASSGGVHLESAGIDLTDQASLQRGAKYFANYCMGCHSLKHMRYNRMAEDLGIPETDLRQNLIFNGAKPGELMKISMRPEDGEKWFGTAVPDLTLVTRWRGTDWVYTYLKSFYVDPSRPYGVNNTVFPNVGMPHVLQGLQGVQRAVYTEAHAAEGDEGAEAHKVLTGLDLVEAGSMSPADYDVMLRDIAAFLTYAGEPMQLERKRLGVYVLLFLGVLFILAFALKKEFWRDVH